MTWTSATSTLNYDRLLHGLSWEEKKPIFTVITDGQRATIRKPPFSTAVGIERSQVARFEMEIGTGLGILD